MIQDKPLDIGHRRELFIDSFLVDRMEGTARRFHKPQVREKALVLDMPWEGGRCGYGSVCTVNGIHYMYYRGSGYVNPRDRRDNTAGPEVTCVALSADGINWKRPELLYHQEHYPGTNNIVLDDIYYSHNFSAFVDTAPGVPDSERFKALAGSHISMLPERYPGHEMGVSAFVSADGLLWKRKGYSPIMDGAEWPEESDKSSIPAFWSEPEGCYVAYFRVRTGPSHLRTAKRLRWIARTTSPDFVHWSKVELVDYDMHYTDAQILANDDRTLRITNEELYTSQVRPYCRAPDIYLSFPNRIVSGRRILSQEELEKLDIADLYDRPEVDTSIHDSILMISRDGKRFEIPTKDAFLRPGYDRKNWDNRNQYLHTGMIQTSENELSMYFNRHGFNRSSPSTTHFMRCTVRVDGFASINAPYEGGELVTKPLRFDGTGLEVNYGTSAAGSIAVELQDTSGQVLPGFQAENCNLLIGDEISRTVTWRGGADVASLIGKPIRLRFFMKDSDLYSLRFISEQEAI